MKTNQHKAMLHINYSMRHLSVVTSCLLAHSINVAHSQPGDADEQRREVTNNSCQIK